jgi:branched-chain amino acid transport system ATP-binding protein
MALLEVHNLAADYGDVRAVWDVSLEVDAGEIVALIGPNGAGKTTCFNLMCGALKPTAGSVTLEGTDITGLPPEQVAGRGLIRTFQIVRPMRRMTVLENVMMGAFARTSDVSAAANVAATAISRVGLAGKTSELAGNLTLPDLKMLELARALAAEPRMLLLDEVMAGLRPAESERMASIVRELRATGMTILLIEHVMRVVMALATRVIVLHLGEKIAEGTPAEIGTNRKVIESYLGTKTKLA